MMRKHITSYVDAGFFSGSVVVARDGNILLRESFGPANRDWGILNTPGTKFRIGSVTKQFTAAAVLQLEQEGALSINDPITNYYEDAPADWSEVKIHHLLNHTSGIPSYTDLPGFHAAMSTIDRTPREIVEMTQNDALKFAPGSQFEYNNTGYILLGCVIEKVSGLKYSEYLRKNIFDPLGMDASGYDNGRAILTNRASGYTLLPSGEVINAPYLAMSLPYAGGSLYSTVDDLLIWDDALDSGKVLGPASLGAMFTDYGHRYGFGWDVGEQFGRPVQFHTGGAYGFQATIRRYPKDRVTVIALANLDYAPSDKIAEELAGICFGAFQPPVEVDLNWNLLDRLVGRYQVRADFVEVVFRRGDRLFSCREGEDGAGLPLIALSDRHLVSKILNVEFTFQFDDKGKTIGVVRRENDREECVPKID